MSEQRGEGTTIRSRIYDLTYRRDGDRAEWLGRTRLVEEDGTLRPRSSFDFVHVSDGTRFVSADRRFTNTEYDGMMERDVHGNLWVLSANDCYGGFLYGVVPGIGDSRSVAELLSRATDLRVVAEEKVGGTATYVLGAKTDYGDFKLWIAPERGYHALKYTWGKSGDDVFRDDIVFEDSVLSEWSLVVDDIKVQRIGDVFVPISGRHQIVARRKDGRVRMTEHKVRCSGVELYPDFEELEAFSLHLPDGTYIADVDHPGISYHVVGNELVPNVDDLVLGVIQQEIPRFKACQGTDETTVEQAAASPSPSAEGDVHLGRVAESPDIVVPRGNRGLIALGILGSVGLGGVIIALGAGIVVVRSSGAGRWRERTK